MIDTIGFVKLWGKSTPPDNWEFCDGQKKDPQNSAEGALFSILGTQFGGDGRFSFYLPKLDPVGKAKYIICVKGQFPSRAPSS